MHAKPLEDECVLYELVYRSTIAPDAGPNCIPDIARVSRSFNRNNDITGILVFDGAHFCQLFEGDHETITALIKRIEADPRHTDFRILHQGFREGERRFLAWSMAFTLEADGKFFDVLAAHPSDRIAELLADGTSTLQLDAPPTP